LRILKVTLPRAQKGVVQVRVVVMVEMDAWKRVRFDAKMSVKVF
jgi:hypothetical protein